MSDTTLPPELLHEIFDHLEPTFHKISTWQVSPWTGSFRTKADLHACSLVSRDWHRLVRPHIFRFVKYSFRRSLMAGEAPWDPPLLNGMLGRWAHRPGPRSAACPNKTLEMFCEFLEAIPTVCPYLRGLSLRCCPGVGESDPLPPSGEREASAYDLNDRIHPSLLGRLLSLLPQLHTLHLENIILTCAPTNQALSAPSIRGLNISYIKFRPSSRDTSALLGCFKAVGELCLTHPGTDNRPIGGGPVPTSVHDYTGPWRLSIRTLNICDVPDPIGYLLRGLRQSPCLNSIRRIKILSISATSVPQLQAFVDQVGEQLVEVHYDLSTTASTLDPTFEPAVLDLSRCAGLRRVTVSLYLGLPTGTTRNANVLHASRILSNSRLSKSSNPLFEGISFDIHTTLLYYPMKSMGPARESAAINAPTLDSAVLDIVCRFPVVEVLVAGTLDAEEKKSVRVVFPCLNEQGALAFGDIVPSIE